MTKQDVQVDRSAIIFDYFANHNQAGVVAPVTGLNRAPLRPIMMIVLYLCSKKIMFLKTKQVK